jgi:L1 cell adhesion molecule like protein
MTKDNTLLGKFQLDNIPKMPRGSPQIEVIYDVDANGILNVSAAEKSTGITQKIKITNDKGRLTTEEIERMVQEAEKYKEEDDMIREKIDSKVKLESYAYQVRNSLNNELKDYTEKDLLEEKVKEIESAIEGSVCDSKNAYDELFKELEIIYQKALSEQKPETEPETKPDISTEKQPVNEPSIEEID